MKEFGIYSDIWKVVTKAQGTPDHAGIIFRHARPFSSQDMPEFVQEVPDIRNFDVKVLNYPSKCYLAFYLSVLFVVKCLHCFCFVEDY